ncbi:MAG TPA: DUF5666 domain-containing protein [Thermoanaerobaculia bacterium]|jgi:hypothetical protein
MRIRLAVVMMVVAALAACQRGERATVTGGYGASVVSGVVVMGDGGTPAGVKVTIAGTGLAAVLTADGSFAFAEAPEQAELQFHRAADGISASLQVSAAAGPVVVELSQSGAKKGSKRRSSGGGNPVSQFEGVVRSATATEVVVFTSKKVEQAIALTPETAIRRGKTVLTAADLTADTRVHVKAIKTATGFTAIAIVVQGGAEPDESPVKREYEGLVVSSAAAQLAITDSKGVTQTFILDAATVIRKGNTAVLATAIQPGWRVHVKATTNADGTLTATRVTVQNTGGDDGDDDDDDAEVKLSGRIAAVAAASLTVQTDAGVVTVQTDASTKIEKHGDDVALSALAAGEKVKVEGTRVDATTVLAKEIEVK